MIKNNIAKAFLLFLLASPISAACYEEFEDQCTFLIGTQNLCTAGFEGNTELLKDSAPSKGESGKTRSDQCDKAVRSFFYYVIQGGKMIRIDIVRGEAYGQFRPSLNCVEK